MNLIYETTEDMQYGAVAMFDVLGFKGIWKEERAQGRWTPAHVIHKMAEIQNIANESREEFIRGWPAAEAEVDLSLRVLCLSDTVIVFVPVNVRNWTPYVDDPAFTQEQNEQLRDGMEAEWLLRASACLKVCAMVATRIIGVGAIEVPEFNYRGAISYGQFHYSEDGSFFLGPAVDECAEHYELAEGAFVLLTPEALAFRKAVLRSWETLEVLHETIDKPIGAGLAEVIEIRELLPYRVQLKEKSEAPKNFETLVLNPLANWDQEAWADRIKALISFFGDSPSVAVKRHNTAEFLETVQRQEHGLDEG